MALQQLEPVKPVVDTLSVTTLVGTLFGLLPHIASILTIVWMLIRIWETATVQAVRKKRRFPST